MSWVELYVVLFALGSYHGINPAMGWLFASARAMQTKSRATLICSLIALTLGHMAAIAFVLFFVGWLGYALPFRLLGGLVAAALIGLGVYHIVRTRHPGWFGMQIGTLGIFCWSFVMATAHGAGLMLLPFLMNTGSEGKHNHFSFDVPFSLTTIDFILVLCVHALGYAVVITILSFLVYEKLGLSILKKAWINFDLIWAVTLILSGVFVAISMVVQH